jgi:hypothetical protein
MKDEFQFTAPFGFLGRLAERLFLAHYMTRFLTQRAAALKSMAESDEWRSHPQTDGEQAGTGRPATQPMDELEDGDKPQPEVEGRSRQRVARPLRSPINKCFCLYYSLQR